MPTLSNLNNELKFVKLLDSNIFTMQFVKQLDSNTIQQTRFNI